MSLLEKLQMGSYGSYVWGSYGLTLVVLVLNAVLARRRHAAARLELARRRRTRSAAP